MHSYDLIIIGGGPAGMAAALSAHSHGVKNILIIERDKELGGILNQCIHNGFGLHHFKKELTGPEYSSLVAQQIKTHNITYLTDTMVLKLKPNKIVHAINSQNGYMQLQAKAIVLAMGCRERTRGAIRIHGTRSAGVYTAGTAQRLINMDGYMPGKKVVILGSGDIGLIMARRMTLEGAKVEAVLEILPYSNGLTRNIVQCLNDYNIPLLLSHTILQIHGNNRVEGVTTTRVDEKLQPISGTERFIACDTLLLSVGLIPENEISRQAGIKLDQHTGGPVVGELRQTNIDGIFACGNVLQVHDLVDFVSTEGELAGMGAAQYIADNFHSGANCKTAAGNGISYVIPHTINSTNINDELKLFMRVKNVYRDHVINAYADDKLITTKKEHKFLPAEMVTVTVKKADLVNCSTLTVKVEAQ